MTLSALASEIYEDLQTEESLEAGATIRDLYEWIPEPMQALRDALHELKTADLIHKRGNHWFPGPRARPRWHVSEEQAQIVQRLLGQGKRQYEVAEVLGLSTQTIGRIAKRAA